MDVRSWDVRTPNGQLVETVEDLAATRAVPFDDARDWILGNVDRRRLPAALVADAHRAR
jgi:hypothetical protein